MNNQTRLQQLKGQRAALCGMTDAGEWVDTSLNALSEIDAEIEDLEIQENYYFSLNHENNCKEDVTILIPTTPGSFAGRYAKIQVCDECHPILWAQYSKQPAQGVNQ